MQQPRRPSFRLPSSTAAVTFQLVFVRAIAGRRLVAAPSTSGHAAISASSLEARPRAVPCSGTCCSVRPRHVMAVIDHLLPPVSIKAAPKSASAVVALRQKLAPFPGHDVVQSRPHPCSKYSSFPCTVHQHLLRRLAAGPSSSLARAGSSVTEIVHQHRLVSFPVSAPWSHRQPMWLALLLHLLLPG
ncbi:uncharacterized protein [Lolium perenne]|uniref:uncharacterized protein isoform X2 n=1 Tax=Lolium perenne TaxID=4522 RepID=UPI0021F689B3|nr:uncharacterized protein LOC127315015 isoform X3 [Lolium perenne]